MTQSTPQILIQTKADCIYLTYSTCAVRYTHRNIVYLILITYLLHATNIAFICRN